MKPILRVFNETLGVWEDVGGETVLTKEGIEEVLVGEVNSHNHPFPNLTKAGVEAVLIGEISSHSHVTQPIASTDVAYHNQTYLTVEAALDQLLYVPTSITSFNLNDSGNVTQEIGSSLVVTHLDWATNKTGAASTINGLNASSPYSVNSEITTNTNYVLLIDDGKTTATATRTVSFSHKRYWGASALLVLSDSDILTLNSELSGSKSQTRSINCSAQYIYFAWPSSWGVPSFTVNGLANTAWSLVRNDAFVNASGYSENFRVYRSDNLLTGTFTVGVS